jgi:hypothetical protein
MIIISKKILDLPKSKSKYFIFKFNSFFDLLSVFDSVPIPYPKREFITDEQSDTTNTHMTKTESTIMVKTEASSVALTQQQQQQQQHNLVQQAHSQQVDYRQTIFFRNKTTLHFR